MVESQKKEILKKFTETLEDMFDSLSKRYPSDNELKIAHQYIQSNAKLMPFNISNFFHKYLYSPFAYVIKHREMNTAEKIQYFIHDEELKTKIESVISRNTTMKYAKNDVFFQVDKFRQILKTKTTPEEARLLWETVEVLTELHELYLEFQNKE